MTRKSPVRNLDKFSASPVGDKAEFSKAFTAVQKAYPGIELGYIGFAKGEHFFQLTGDPVAYVVPASRGWSPRC